MESPQLLGELLPMVGLELGPAILSALSLHIKQLITVFVKKLQAGSLKVRSAGLMGVF